jgi:YesN/AraC family two-component response regulator
MNQNNNTSPAISILFVEDDKATLDIFATIIPVKYPDVTLHTANNGRAGLELFKTHMSDIVITDINMPEMGGVQMAEKIRAINPEAKIIVLTADTGKGTLESAVGDGVVIDYYIMKPVNFEMLFVAIEQCIGEIKQQIS